MNTKQKAALDALVARLVADRQMESTEQNPGYTTEIENDKVLVCVTALNDFPIVTIGKGGRFDMPDVKSFPETNGMTALDAAVWGDWHIARQREGRKRGRQLPYGPQTEAAEPVVEQPTEAVAE